MNLCQEDVSDSVANLFWCETKFVPTDDSMYTYARASDARSSVTYFGRRIDQLPDVFAE